MEKFKKLVYIVAEKTGYKPEDVFAFVFSVGIAGFFFLDTTYFHNKLVVIFWIFIAVILTLFISWLFMKAVATVLSSLFLLSAEISLLIFLAQSYCDAVKVPAPGDNALRTFVGFGIYYISYKFFQYLFNALKIRLDSFPEKKWTKTKIFIVVLFVLFTVSFVWTVIQVTSPIISNLCIYKK